MTLTLTSDDIESHIVVNVSSTLTNTAIWFVAALSLIVDIRTYVQTHGRTFLPRLLGHLFRDDLKIDKNPSDGITSMGLGLKFSQAAWTIMQNIVMLNFSLRVMTLFLDQVTVLLKPHYQTFHEKAASV